MIENGKCVFCGERPSHKNYLADLRNKYGRLNTYFQLKEAVADPECKEGIKRMFAKVEKEVLKNNKDFVTLLKTDTDTWEKENGKSM